MDQHFKLERSNKSFVVCSHKLICARETSHVTHVCELETRFYLMAIDSRLFLLKPVLEPFFSNLLRFICVQF